MSYEELFESCQKNGRLYLEHRQIARRSKELLDGIVSKRPFYLSKEYKELVETYLNHHQEALMKKVIWECQKLKLCLLKSKH